MPFCTKCGTDMSADFSFCSKCGQPSAEVAQNKKVDDFTSRTPVRELLKKSAPWAIALFERRTTGASFLDDTAIANLMGMTRMNSQGNHHTFWCIIGEESIGLFNDHGSLLAKEKGWAVSFPLKNLRNVRLVPGRTNLSYSNGESYVADYWILNWPISVSKPWPELEERSEVGFWKKVNEPIDPHLDVWCNSKNDPLYEKWVVVLPFEESGDPELRNRYAESLAQQIGHFPDFHKADGELISQSIRLKIQQGSQSGGWFSFIGDFGGN